MKRTIILFMIIISIGVVAAGVNCNDKELVDENNRMADALKEKNDIYEQRIEDSILDLRCRLYCKEHSNTGGANDYEPIQGICVCYDDFIRTDMIVTKQELVDFDIENLQLKGQEALI